MYRFVIIAFFAVIFYLIIASWAKRKIRKFFGQQADGKIKPGIIDKGMMVKCSTCGAYFAIDGKNAYKNNKNDLHFCSDECFQKFEGN